MLTGLLHAHSGLRYLILLLAVLHLVVCIRGTLIAAPFKPGARVIGAMLAGCLHLQLVLGLGLLALGMYTPPLIGHMVLMIGAAIAFQVMLIRNRRSTTPGYKLPLIATVVLFVLLTGGTFAIGRHPFESKFGVVESPTSTPTP